MDFPSIFFSRKKCLNKRTSHKRSVKTKITWTITYFTVTEKFPTYNGSQPYTFRYKPISSMTWQVEEETVLNLFQQRFLRNLDYTVKWKGERGKWWIGKNVEWSGRDLISRYYSGIQLTGWGKSWKTLLG
jgi:hypothetical protein